MTEKKSLIGSFKAKLIIGLVLSISLATLPNFASISANTADETSNGTCSSETNSSNADIQVLNTKEEDGKIITTFSDGTSSIEYEDGTIDLIIPTSSAFITDEEKALLQGVPGAIQPRGFFAIAAIIAKIVGGIVTTCYVVQWITNGFDPCMAARQYLGKGRSGKYIVQGKYIAGRIPGCEPMHSLPCNSGYYQYKFVPN